VKPPSKASARLVICCAPNWAKPRSNWPGEAQKSHRSVAIAGSGWYIPRKFTPSLVLRGGDGPGD
jgi:hypothetical protein